MSRRQGYIIIALLAVIAVALAVLVGALVTAGDDDDSHAGAEQGPPPAPSTETAVEEVADPAAALADAGLDVVLPPPVPDAPDAWGDYQLDASWDGQLRVFDGGDLVPVDGEAGGVFPASQNSCGFQAYFVTFRAVGDGVKVDARLVNAVGEPADSAIMSDGWMLGTNCVTPSFAFHSSDHGATLTEVAYSVYRYRQASVAQEPVAPQQPQVQAPPPAPAAPAEPTFVECLFGTPGPARFSDGSIRNHQPCRETPEARASIEAERNCNDADWRRRMQAEGDRFCGSTAWADGFYE